MSLNTEEFLSSTTDEQLDDRLDPCPAGDHLAIAGKPEIKDFVFQKGVHQGETGYRLVIRWEIQSEEIKKQLDRETVSVTQSVLLDVTADGTGLDMGKGKQIGP